MPADLTPTSYAILGLLAIKPWTTYELAQQMSKALSQFWPRTESKLYEEPKKLVAHGLARATKDKVGNRPRTVYTITPKGRRALAAWVPTPGAGPALEFELLIKVFFAENGSKDDLLRTIDNLRDWIDERATVGGPLSQNYLDGKGQFPERLPWLILVGRFLNDFTQLVDGWADWAQGVVETWPDDISTAEPDWAALEAMATESSALLEKSKARDRMAEPSKG